MKIYSLLAACFLVVCCVVAYPALAASAVTPFVEDSSLVIVNVTGDNVRVRSGPHVDSETVGRFDTGTILVVEKWPVRSGDMAWYKIISMVDKDSGRITDVLYALPELSHRPYVSATFVQPYSGSHAARYILAQIAATPYGEGYNAVDASSEGQRAMAGKSTLRLVSFLLSIGTEF